MPCYLEPIINKRLKGSWRSSGFGRGLAFEVWEVALYQLFNPAEVARRAANGFAREHTQKAQAHETERVEGRALDLLRSQLDTNQRWELAQHDYFHVRGASGRMWRVTGASCDNLHEVDETCTVVLRQWCVAIYDYSDPDGPSDLPAPDRMLTMMLAVTNEELERELVGDAGPVAHLRWDFKEVLDQGEVETILPGQRPPTEGVGALVPPAHEWPRTVSVVYGRTTVEHHWSNFNHRGSAAAVRSRSAAPATWTISVSSSDAQAQWQEVPIVWAEVSSDSYTTRPVT